MAKPGRINVEMTLSDEAKELLNTLRLFHNALVEKHSSLLDASEQLCDAIISEGTSDYTEDAQELLKIIKIDKALESVREQIEKFELKCGDMKGGNDNEMVEASGPNAARGRRLV